MKTKVQERKTKHDDLASTIPISTVAVPPPAPLSDTVLGESTKITCRYHIRVEV